MTAARARSSRRKAPARDHVAEELTELAKDGIQVNACQVGKLSKEGAQALGKIIRAAAATLSELPEPIPPAIEAIRAEARALPDHGLTPLIEMAQSLATPLVWPTDPIDRAIAIFRFMRSPMPKRVEPPKWELVEVAGQRSKTVRRVIGEPFSCAVEAVRANTRARLKGLVTRVRSIVDPNVFLTDPGGLSQREEKDMRALARAGVIPWTEVEGDHASAEELPE